MKQIKESGIENPDITDKIKKKKKKITKEENAESDNLDIIIETKEVNSDDNKKNKVKNESSSENNSLENNSIDKKQATEELQKENKIEFNI